MGTKRLGSIEGAALAFVTTRCSNWNPIFLDSKAAQGVVTQLGKTAALIEASIVAYVVMPTHFHGLIGFPNFKLMPQFMRHFKRQSATLIKYLNIPILKEELSQTGQFSVWHRRFDDFIVYSEEQFRIKLDYIHNNPVNAGLVKSAIEWKYSSARDWLLGEKGLIPIDKTTCWFR